MKVIHGEGMPTYKNPFHKGDLIVKFTIQFPEDNFATEEQLKVSDWLIARASVSDYCYIYCLGLSLETLVSDY